MASNTGCTLSGELAITLRMSAGCGLPFQCLLGLIEKTRVFDGDYSLIGEGSQKLNLLFVKRSNGNSTYYEYSNGVAFAEKRYAEVCAKAA